MSKTSRNKVELLTSALSYLEANLTEKITTEDVAKVCYCSKSTLEKLFRCVSHTSVHDYIIRRRMSQAAKFLFSHPESGVLEVALLYGYNSHEAFTRAFKQVWNCTPSELRSRARYSEIFPRLTFDLEEGDTIMKKVDISELYDFLRKREGCYYIIGDIVGLVPINDIAYAAGDLALIEALNRMNRVARDEDIVFRIGPDEFVLLTDSKDPEYAKKLASEIESQNGDTFTYEDREIPLSLYVLSSALNKGAHGDNGGMLGQFQQTINDFKKTLPNYSQA